MKTIIGTQTDVIKELTAQVADALARKPEANIAISAVDLPAEVLGALAASDIAFDKATLFQLQPTERGVLRRHLREGREVTA